MPAMRHAQKGEVSDISLKEDLENSFSNNEGIPSDFYHVVNRGNNFKKVFVDDNDFETFKLFLKDYLDVPPHPESYRKEFTIKGKIYKGIPHKSKNYFGLISLIAYSFDTDHFHLLLNKSKSGSIERFMRSLLTRYSMYYNKKHSSKGSLFEGPYKSINITNQYEVVLLSKYLNTVGKYNSIKNYIGNENIVEKWVSANTLENIYNESTHLNNKKYNYSQYIEKVKFTNDDNKLLERISLDPQLDSLERIPESLERSVVDMPKTMKGSNPDVSKPISQLNTPRPSFVFNRAFYLLSAFIFLFNFSLQRVISNQKINIKSSVSADTVKTQVLGTSMNQYSQKVMIKTANKNTRINIHLSPDINSQTIYQANNNESFELVSSSKNWFEILLPDGSKGYLINSYAQRTN